MNSIFKSYPLTFTSILKDRIWGGTKLQTILNKTIPTQTTGESWELSTVEGDVSTISNGIYKGINFQELINQFPEQILGTKVHKRFGTNFPLLFKFLDAKQDLSIQVHPNDALAQKRHNCFGKTEMWYIMQADENAKILVGFKQNSSKTEYLQALQNNKILDLLEHIPVSKGDVFMLETGTVHAIGSGIVLAEIQQTSDITYRIFDFDRIDSNGNKRELHTDLALEAINYNTTQTQKTYNKIQNKSNNLVDSPYFTTNQINLTSSVDINKNHDSFRVYMCVEGKFQLLENNTKHEFKAGETVLIPACSQAFSIAGNATLLEIYIS
jgi:mannose-6-phosphate isomerase